MSTDLPASFFVTDIGNSRIKIGWFEIGRGNSLPTPTATLDLTPSELENDRTISTWLSSLLADRCRSRGHRPTLPTAHCLPPTTPWHIASVNRTLTDRLHEVLHQIKVGQIFELSYSDLPIDVNLDAPERVGIDRLLAAVAVNHVRRLDRPAVVVDLGTAITVDLISTDGAFMGGAILPGIAMAARAMTEQTDALPQSPLAELHNPPPAVGKSTLTAIESGLFWGAIGAIRELVAQYTAILTTRPDLYLTGGAAPQVSELLARDEQQTRHMPHLVLSGIAMVVHNPSVVQF